MDHLNKLMLDKSGQRVNSLGHVLGSDGKALEIEVEEDGKKVKKPVESTVHSTYYFSRIEGMRAIHLGFQVQEVLQPHTVAAQGKMVDMLDAEDRAAVAKSGKEMDEDMQMKYGGRLREIQGEVISKLKASDMFELTKLLFEHVSINNENGLKALDGHFRNNMSHILPVLKEIIRVNDFLDLDMTALL